MADVPVWATMYPSVAAVAEASFSTLAAWHAHLPEPQTDVERTVRRRIASRFEKEGMKELEATAPNIAKKLRDIQDSMAKLGIKVPKPF